ncbi:MAG: PKD domain-containing protein, partial [Chitinophagaceae bacterium]|nr:PKD domain-containing protein [Chitinophagaceae bacterium]
PIQGQTTVCPGSATSYSLPALPGTFYKWVLSSGGIITPYDSNHNVITINWQNMPPSSGPHTLTCTYTNPYTGCKGQSSIQINVRPKFQLNGPQTVCTNTPANYVANGPVATWTFTPNTGFTNTPTSPASQQIIWNTPGNYSITVTPQNPSNFCTNSASISVTVNPKPVLSGISGPAVICPNQSYSYSVTSSMPGNINWSITGGGTIAPYGTDNTSATALFSGNGPWTITAIQTVNGCADTSKLTVTMVSPPPAITLSTNSICSGGTVTASVTGPVPPGGYIWSSTPGAVLVSGQGTTSATFTVNSNATITLSNCVGTSTANVTVTTVNLSVSQTPGTCSATLTASPSGATYTWYLNGNQVATGNPVTVTQNGQYVVHAVFPNGCVATGQTVVNGLVTVNAVINAIGNICSGPVTLQVPALANCSNPTYQWSNGATGNPITVNTPGTYTVTVTCSNGCSDVSDPIIIPPCPSPQTCDPKKCINDITITGINNCSNPVNLSLNIPPGCTPVQTFWLFGDGSSGTNGTHTYTYPGTYLVHAYIQCSNGTILCDTAYVTVPAVIDFTHVITCGTNSWNVLLQDATLFLPSYAGYTRNWSTTCGTLSSVSAASPTLTVPAGCNPTVTLTISKGGCTYTKNYTFSFPNTPLNINGPSSVCAGTVNQFSSSWTSGILAYNWNMGDGTTGVTNPIAHAYNGSVTNPTITLSVKDKYGCVLTATKPVTVLVPPKLKITPGPVVKVCPECPPTQTLTVNNPSAYNGYQWYQNGNPITGATSSSYTLCTFNASGNYWVTATHTATNCSLKSDTVVVLYHPKPVAKIQGPAIHCVTGNAGSSSFTLQNSVNNPNYSYTWFGSGPGSIIFNPNNQQQTTVTVSAFGNYVIILTVTDNTTGCVAKDTFCVSVNQNPTVTIAPGGYKCEGILHTFNVVSPNSNYLYGWNNGVYGTSMTTGMPGTYFAYVVNPVSGCTGQSNPVFIKKRPYLDLFPIGCDTLCDTAKFVIVPPLPLGPEQTYNSLYNIQRYVNNAYHSTGPSLNIAGWAAGNYNIYIVVNFIGDTCSAKSGTYNLVIKPCKKCNCKDSKWEQILMTSQPASQGGVKLTCGNTYNLNCNQPVTVSTTYVCKDTACPPKVTYTLQPPTGSALTGNAPVNFTPTQSGTYILTLYGWCKDLKCDSCVIKFNVKCDTLPGDCCKGATWRKILGIISMPVEK